MSPLEGPVPRVMDVIPRGRRELLRAVGSKGEVVIVGGFLGLVDRDFLVGRRRSQYRRMLESLMSSKSGTADGRTAHPSKEPLLISP